ncbi:putative F-box protein [Spatholobus suberectus]|nr:putative F-box protein [Spatholobus suberectus]
MAVTLSEDLVEDILERLPAKSLVRFKSVARSWNALFRTNSFIRRHSQRQKKGSDERLMIVHADRIIMPTPIITLLSSHHPTLFHLPATQYSFLPQFDLYYVYFYHCSGVVCFCIGSKIVLWNPATREVKDVPTREVTLPESPVNYRQSYRGFGDDRDTFNDFKLIEFNVTFTGDSNNDLFPLVFAEVYSTSTNSWTVLRDVNANDLTPINKLPHFSYTDFYFLDRVYGNGVFYWLSSHYTYILCFDFGSNQFRILDTPTTLPSTIFEAGDSIGFAVKYSVSENWEENQFQIGFEIWILKQDGSWTKIYKYNVKQSFYTAAKMYAIWKDGAEILAGYPGMELVSYNSDGEPLLQFQLLIDMHKYVESIAPLSL